MSSVRFILRNFGVNKLRSVWTRGVNVSNAVRRYRRDGSVRDVIICFRQAFFRPRRTLLLSATAAYKAKADDEDKPPSCEQNIADEELEALLSELDTVVELSQTLYCPKCNQRLVIEKKQPGVHYCTCKVPPSPTTSEDGWEPYMEAEDVIIWRKEYKPGQGLYAYKVYGRYNEVVASHFAAVQVDNGYRRHWDAAVAALAVVERSSTVQDQAVLHWEVLWPRLFANRDYVYIRRHKEFDVNTPPTNIFKEPVTPIIHAEERPSVHSNAKRKAEEAYSRMGDRQPVDNKVYIIISKSCEHPKVPETKHAIRVSEYWSNMVVRTIEGAENPGMEFVLTYYDEPAVGGLPPGVAAWATGRAAPNYLNKMRRAAHSYTTYRQTQPEEPDTIPLSPEKTAYEDTETIVRVSEEDMEVLLMDSSKQGPEIENAETTTKDKSTQTEIETPRDETNVTKKDIGVETDHIIAAKDSKLEDPDDEEEPNTRWWHYLHPFYYFLARLSFPTVETKPYNLPSTKEIDPKYSYADEKFEKLQEYYSYMNGRMKEPNNPTERREILESAEKKLFDFIDTHIKDLKRLLFATDQALMSMVLLKLNKKMDTSEAKIKSTQAKIPFGLYVSPEFKCLDTSYYIASAHNQEDAQMILSSERKPHCYTFRGAFSFSGFYHRHSETQYVGPHSEQFQAKDPSQGLYCHSDDNWSDAQCIYKINPREEFPESVEYEPKVSYWCGPYRYFIPATADVRCVFSIFSMNFVFRFGYDGVTYKSSDLSFMYQNGQVFYTDEPWAGMSCWNWACKWRHNQNQRSNEFFVN